MNIPAIDVVNVSKVYRRYARRRQFATLKSALLDGSLLGDLKPDETFQALKNVSFQVPKGCTYGVIGSNGSGKSTLLKCVAGITRPTEGEVKVDGRISAKSTISSKRRMTSFFVRPSMMPLMKMFSRPEISGWKPAPSSISAEIRPSTAMVPLFGRELPATHLSSVDLPDPLRPMTP